jgi:DNA-binding transcriptional regulator YhcF (GntR family)
MKEIYMSGAFGYEETEDMDGKDTYKYLIKNMGMEPDDAKERTKQQGKDPSGKKDKKSKYYKDKNFITRATLSEIQRQKAIKMVEDLLTKKNSDNSEVGKKVNADTIEELPLLIRKNLKSLLNNVEKHGFSKEDIIKLIKKGE